MYPTQASAGKQFNGDANSHRLLPICVVKALQQVMQIMQVSQSVHAASSTKYMQTCWVSG